MRQEEFEKAVAPLLNAIFEAHGKPLPSAAVRVLWFSALERFDVRLVIEAIKKHMGRAEATFSVVQPNDIVLLIEGSPEDRAGVAWQKFLAAVRVRSPYGSIVFDDPVIHATVQHLGGWVRITGEMAEDEREQFRRAFETNYKLFLKAGLPEATPLRLAGLIESQHVQRGLPYDGPVQLVGDSATAQLVAQGQHPALPHRSTLALPGQHGAV